MTGTVVDGTDAGAVAAAVAGLLRSPSQAAAMGAAGRAWVTSQWSWDLSAQRLTQLLHPGTDLRAVVSGRGGEES